MFELEFDEMKMESGKTMKNIHKWAEKFVKITMHIEIENMQIDAGYFEADMSIIWMHSVIKLKYLLHILY